MKELMVAKLIHSNREFTIIIQLVPVLPIQIQVLYQLGGDKVGKVKDIIPVAIPPLVQKPLTVNLKKP